MSSIDLTVVDTDSHSRSDLHGQRVALLLGRSAITGAADSDMQALVDQLSSAAKVAEVRHAYCEQGSPSLRESLTRFAHERVSEIVLLPILLPMEPSFRIWISRSIERWCAADSLRAWPRIRIAEPPAQAPGTRAWLHAWLVDGLSGDFAQPSPRSPAGSVVPPQQQRVLVCQGGPCNDAGATVIWAHLRNEQKRLNLRTTGAGVMTCKTTCLGPCNLAPVLQVFPEGTYYGGIDESGIDRIVHQHLQAGCVVEELAYAPLPQRQTLRLRSVSVETVALEPLV